MVSEKNKWVNDGCTGHCSSNIDFSNTRLYILDILDSSSNIINIWSISLPKQRLNLAQ